MAEVLFKAGRGGQRTCVEAFGCPAVRAFWAHMAVDALKASSKLFTVAVNDEKGDVLLFHGDLVHAGAAYPEADNIRMHVYLYAKESMRPGKSTWHVPEFAPNQVVTWATWK